MLQTLWTFPAIRYKCRLLSQLLMHHGRLCCRHYGHFPPFTTNAVCSLNCLCIMVDYVANTMDISPYHYKCHLLSQLYMHHSRLCCKHYGHFPPFTTNAVCSLNCLCVMVDYVANNMDISRHSLQMPSALSTAYASW